MSAKRMVRPNVELPATGDWYTPAMRRWLCGYEPVLADESIKRRSPYLKGLAATKKREAAAQAGIGWGVGTIESLGRNTRPMDNRAIQPIKIEGRVATTIQTRKAA